MKNKDNINNYLLIILATVGFIFFRSGFGKITGGKFIEGIGPTLSRFASENPYSWYVFFLEYIAIPNSAVFGMLVMWGEVFAGLGIIASAVYLVFKKQVNQLVILLFISAIIVGLLLNGSFLFAAGHTSPSVESLNVLMIVVGLAGVAYAVKLMRKTEGAR